MATVSRAATRLPYCSSGTEGRSDESTVDPTADPSELDEPRGSVIGAASPLAKLSETMSKLNSDLQAAVRRLQDVKGYVEVWAVVASEAPLLTGGCGNESDEEAEVLCRVDKWRGACTRLRESIDEAVFDSRLHTSRALNAASQSAAQLVGVTEVFCRCEETIAQLTKRQQVLQDQTSEGRLVGGARYLAATWAASHQQSGSGANVPPRHECANDHCRCSNKAGALPPLSSAMAADDTTGGRGAGLVAEGEGCVHRTLLATNIIDRTFDEHRRRMRQLLHDAEAEIERLKSGRALKDAQSANEHLKERLLKKDAEIEEYRERSMQAIAAAQRLGAATHKVTGADPSPASVVRLPPQPLTKFPLRPMVDAAVWQHLEMLGDVAHQAVIVKLNWLIEVAIGVRHDVPGPPGNGAAIGPPGLADVAGSRSIEPTAKAVSGSSASMGLLHSRVKGSAVQRQRLDDASGVMASQKLAASVPVSSAVPVPTGTAAAGSVGGASGVFPKPLHPHPAPPGRGGAIPRGA